MRGKTRDESGYGRRILSHDAELTEVSPGSPGGELLRAFWQPVALSTDAGSTPKPVRVLGEDLILFRDGQGRPGLLDERCCHRGSSLYYGAVEAEGIRCCYHGWLYDVEGRCLDQPCEPPDSTYKDKIGQPWYPCRDYGGLVFAYMGPLERMPVFPRYDIVEEGEGTIVADATGYGFGGPAVVECNWLQWYENQMDPFHVMVLHFRFSGEQFSPALATRPDVSWEYTEHGMCSIQNRHLDDGRLFRRVSEVLVPNVRIVPSVAAGAADEGFKKAELVGWFLPIDDTRTTLLTLLRVPLQDGEPVLPPRARHNGKLWTELTEEEHQRMPGDHEAIVSQGPIAVHGLEHLATSDRGVIMIRKMLRESIEALRAGEDAKGIVRDPEADLIETRAGNYLLEPEGVHAGG